ncbi:hypothetical protein Tco_0158770 [Tanacetum coccineum]
MKRVTIISLPSDNSNLAQGKNYAREKIVKKTGEKDELPQKTSVKEPGTFTEKVKRRIKEEQKKGDRLLEILEKEPFNTSLVNTIGQTPDYTKCLQELVRIKQENHKKTVKTGQTRTQERKSTQKARRKLS